MKEFKGGTYAAVEPKLRHIWRLEEFTYKDTSILRELENDTITYLLR